MPYKAKNWHALSREQISSKHSLLYICWCAFKLPYTNSIEIISKCYITLENQRETKWGKYKRNLRIKLYRMLSLKQSKIRVEWT